MRSAGFINEEYTSRKKQSNVSMKKICLLKAFSKLQLHIPKLDFPNPLLGYKTMVRYTWFFLYYLNMLEMLLTSVSSLIKLKETYVSRYGYQFHSNVLYNYMGQMCRPLNYSRARVLYKHLLMEVRVWMFYIIYNISLLLNHTWSHKCKGFLRSIIFYLYFLIPRTGG